MYEYFGLYIHIYTATLARKPINFTMGGCRFCPISVGFLAFLVNLFAQSIAFRLWTRLPLSDIYDKCRHNLRVKICTMASPLSRMNLNNILNRILPMVRSNSIVKQRWTEAQREKVTTPTKSHNSTQLCQPFPGHWLSISYNHLTDKSSNKSHKNSHNSHFEKNFIAVNPRFHAGLRRFELNWTRK